MIARLKPGVSVERAQSELTKVHKAIVAEHPKDYGSPDVLVVPLQREVTLQYRPALLALGVAVVLMLIIAIANMANLQLARLVRRNEEFAIRTALGASSPRLARQLLTEAMLIAVLGGCGGRRESRRWRFPHSSGGSLRSSRDSAPFTSTWQRSAWWGRSSSC